MISDDTGEDASGTDAEAPGREEILGLGIGADAGIFNLKGRDAEVLQLQADGGPEVDVMFVGFGLPFADEIHGKTSLPEGFVDFFSDFEYIQGDAGTNGSLQVAAPCAKALLHGLQGVGYDAADSATPAGMDGGYDLVSAVVE